MQKYCFQTNMHWLCILYHNKSWVLSLYKRKFKTTEQCQMLFYIGAVQTKLFVNIFSAVNSELRKCSRKDLFYGDNEYLIGMTPNPENQQGRLVNPHNVLKGSAIRYMKLPTETVIEVKVFDNLENVLIPCFLCVVSNVT